MTGRHADEAVAGPRGFLVVDDSPAVRAMVEDALVQTGVPSRDVTGLATGDEALRRFSELEPDVVFLDTSIPGVDPYDAAQAMILETPRVRIVVLTELDPSEEAIRELLSYGVFAVLQKPVRAEEIAQVLHELEGQSPGAGRIR